jgi:hypothetical protein
MREAKRRRLPTGVPPVLMEHIDLELQWLTDVRPTPKRMKKLAQRLGRDFVDNPDHGEGVFTMAGIEHYYAYEKLHDVVVEVYVTQRTSIEEIFNEHGLTTHGPPRWPLPGSKIKH